MFDAFLQYINWTPHNVAGLYRNWYWLNPITDINWSILWDGTLLRMGDDVRKILPIFGEELIHDPTKLFPFYNRLFMPMIVYTAVMLVVRLTLEWTVFAWAYDRLCPFTFTPAAGTDAATTKKQRDAAYRRHLKEQKKFREGCFRMLFYTAAVIWWFYYFPHNFPEFVYHNEGLLEEWPRTSITLEIEQYYFIQLAYYLSMIVTIAFETRRKDFYEMILHHFAAVLLIMFSYVTNQVRFGVMVLACHDPSDVLLEGLKLLRYIGLEETIVASVWFVVFSLSWILTRLIFFPYRIIGYVAQVQRNINSWDGYVVDEVCVVFLTILWGLHWFWFSILVKMVYSMIRNGWELDNPLSEDEAEAEERKKNAAAAGKSKQE